jgi:O-antigen/teichoic acid export membrane protein
MAKLGTPAMVGQYALGLAITAPIFMLTNLQLRGIQATDAKNEFSFNNYVGLRFISSLCSILVISLILLFGSFTFEATIVIFLLGLEKGVRSISDVIFGLFQKHERMDLVGISLLIKGPLSLVIMGCLLWVSESIFISLTGLIVAWFLVFLFIDLKMTYLYDNFIPNFNLKKLWKLLCLSLPLGIVMMFVSLNANSPRFFVEYFLGTDILGYFAAIAYIMVAGSTVVNALGQSISPRLSRYYVNGNKNAYISLLVKLVSVSIFFLFIALILVHIWGEEILTILYEPSYGKYAHIFSLITIAAGVGFIKTFLGYGLTAARFLKVQPIITLLAVLVGVVACILLIPGFGLIGAANAMIIASFTHLLGYLLSVVYIVKRYLNQTPITEGI